MRGTRLVIGSVSTIAAVLAWTYGHRDRHLVFQTVIADRGDLRSVVSANGTCSALVTVQVGSQISGNIKALYADFNTIVQKGQMVAEIDPEPFVARLNQAQAAVESAEAGVDSAKATVVKAEADLRGALAVTDSQRASVALAASSEQDSRTKFWSRQKAGDSIVSPEDLETAKTTWDVALANREAADAQEEAADDTVHAMQEALAAAQDQVVAAQAQVREAQALLEQAKLDLTHTRIVAPIDGVVISRDMDVGQTVSASIQAPTLFEIAQDLTQMHVDVNTDESDVGNVKVGQAATFTVDALPGTNFDAKVIQIRQAPINVQNVITYDVVLAVPNPESKLFPGMTANVRIVAGTHANVLRVPNAALRFRPSGTRINTTDPQRRSPLSGMVYSLDASGRPIARRVSLGFSDGSYTEITSDGLSGGDAVVVAEGPSRAAQ